MHIWRMAAYSKILALGMGWSREAAEMLSLAAPMHDTGKIGIPDAILQKPGKLDEKEWQIMRSHCQIGFEILSKSDAPIFRLAAEIALCHHEQWHGGGYPHGLQGEAIPLSGRIIAVADFFDALTMNRHYKEAWPVEQAVAMIRAGSGSHFDPKVVNCFLEHQSAILEVRAQWEQQAAEAV